MWINYGLVFRLLVFVCSLHYGPFASSMVFECAAFTGETWKYHLMCCLLTLQIQCELVHVCALWHAAQSPE